MTNGIGPKNPSGGGFNQSPGGQNQGQKGQTVPKKKGGGDDGEVTQPGESEEVQVNHPQNPERAAGENTAENPNIWRPGTPPNHAMTEHESGYDWGAAGQRFIDILAYEAALAAGIAVTAIAA